MSNDTSVLLSQFDTTSDIPPADMNSYPETLTVTNGRLLATDQLDVITDHGVFQGETANNVSGGSVTEYGAVIIENQDGSSEEFVNIVYDRRETTMLSGTGLKATTEVSNVPYDYMFANPPPVQSATNTQVVFTDGTVMTCSTLWNNNYFLINVLNRKVSSNGDGVVFKGYGYKNPGVRFVRYVFPERRWIAGAVLRNLRTDFGIRNAYIRTSQDGLVWETAATFTIPAVSAGHIDVLFNVVKPVKYVELRVTTEFGQGSALGRFDILEAIGTELSVNHKPVAIDVNKLSVREEADGTYLSVKYNSGGSTVDSLPKRTDNYSKFSVEVTSTWLLAAADYARMLPINKVNVNNLGLKKHRRGVILPKGTYAGVIRTSIQGGTNISAYLADLRNLLPVHEKVTCLPTATATTSTGHDHEITFTLGEDTPIGLYVAPSVTTSQMSAALVDAKSTIATLELWKLTDEVRQQYVTKRTFKPSAAGPEADWLLLRGIVSNGVTPFNQLNGEGLFALPYGGTLSAVQEFRSAANYVIIKVNHDFKLWKYPVGNTITNSFKLSIEKMDGPLIDYTQYSLSTLATADWVAFTDILPPGTYKLAYCGGLRNDYQWYVEKCAEGSAVKLPHGNRLQMIDQMFVPENSTQKLTVSSAINSNYPASDATFLEPIDELSAWYTAQAVVTPAAPQWWAIQFKEDAKTINGYEIVSRATGGSGTTVDAARSWELQGRDADTDDWVTLHTVTDDPRNARLDHRAFFLPAPVTYYQYRFYCTATNRPANDYLCLAVIRLFYEI